MPFHLIVDFSAAAIGVFVMRRMAEEYKLLPKRRPVRCASCGRDLTTQCRCRDGG
jgi:hypothetical protein